MGSTGVVRPMALVSKDCSGVFLLCMTCQSASTKTPFSMKRCFTKLLTAITVMPFPRSLKRRLIRLQSKQGVTQLSSLRNMLVLGQSKA